MGYFTPAVRDITPETVFAACEKMFFTNAFEAVNPD